MARDSLTEFQEEAAKVQFELSHGRSTSKPIEDAVEHPSHYGGKDNPYEAIKVIEAWDLGFNLGNAVKYIARAGKKDPAKALEDLKKGAWYLNREIENRSRKL